MKTILISRTLVVLIFTVVGGVVGDDSEDGASTNKTNCPGFECPTGSCIPSRWLCDGDNDCGDMSDEENCPSTSSTQCSGFTCNNGGECLPQNWQCDGEPDCDEGEDEAGCPCQGFQCPNNGRCIPSGWTCDGDNDCGDDSDETEESCPCTEEETRCPTLPDQRTPGNCIPLEYICDSDDIWDCPDGSDQANCTSQSESEQGQSGSNVPSSVGVRSHGKGRGLGRGIQRSGAWKQYSIRRLTKAYEVEAYEQKYADKRQSSYYNSRSIKNH